MSEAIGTEDAPGITSEKRASLQAIDDADYSEHRPGIGQIVCKYCNLLDCDYDCDESQAGGFDDMKDEQDDLTCTQQDHDEAEWGPGPDKCDRCGKPQNLED